MRRDVRLLASARNDLRRLEAFLRDRSPDAALRATNAIILAVLSLDEFSERGLLNQETGLRELPLHGRDGYTIQYRVDPAIVRVARIFHNREMR